MTLPRPIKSVLQEPSLDQPVARGWSRVQKKRRVRDTARKTVLAVACLLLAASIGWALRPMFPSTMPAVASPVVPVAKAPSAPLDALVKDLPKVQGRAQLVQRPAQPPAPPQQPPVAVPVPEVDVVAALLLSVRDAYDAGDTTRAAALLSEIAERHAADPRAAQALYVLGLIQLDKNHDPKAAADSFTHALELDPPAQLVPELWRSLERARGQ
jgi:hypothetical protein